MTTTFTASVIEFADGSFVIQSVVAEAFWLACRPDGRPLTEPDRARGGKPVRRLFASAGAARAALRAEGFGMEPQRGGD